MVQLTEVSSGLFSSETRSCCPLCFEMLPLQISNSLVGSLHQLPDSIYPQQAMLWIHAKGEMASIAFCCCFFYSYGFIYPNCCQFFKQEKKHQTAFFNMEFYQVKLPVINLCIVIKVFILKLNLSFLFFFIFRFVFGPFY